MYETTKIRRIVVIFGILCLFVILAGVINILRNNGKIQVSIETFPADATVYMDGNEVKSGQYVTPGDHTFVAKKQGFADRSSRVFITSDINTLALPLAPVSDEARAWLDQPENRAKYETFGANLADQEGSSMRTVNPLINKLPYSDIAGPYSINFGFPDAKNKFKIFYSVDYSSPVGRRKAIEWVRSQGVEPSTIDLQFGNYVNPLTGEVY